ncbi:MAG TPA: class I SAM-dependent methyltransferase [Thermoleophilaceae bacterium]|nr:class I SAM-dependent methyltransferase [Thermoleophilaceae bacterium]
MGTTHYPRSRLEDLSVFDEWWRSGVWASSPSPLARRRLEAAIALLGDRRYERALEIGCGTGAFARTLAPLAGRVVALDASREAIRIATSSAPAPNVGFEVANVMEYDLAAEGPWELVAISETLPYIGWAYSLYDLGWLLDEVFAAMAPRGRLLLVDTCSGADDPLYEPWLIATYRDLARNVGFVPEREEVLEGEENGVDYGFLLSLFTRPAGGGPAR